MHGHVLLGGGRGAGGGGAGGAAVVVWQPLLQALLSHGLHIHQILQGMQHGTHGAALLKFKNFLI